MRVSRAYLERCAGETGFLPETLEKVTGLGELADAFARHPLLGRALALKGGTALNLCFGASPGRLSVDLDYNYVGHLEREAMSRERPAVEEAVAVVAERLGFNVQLSAPAFAGRKFYLGYPSVFGPRKRVEVDLNFLWREPVDGLSGRNLWQPGELDSPCVTTVSLLELCVGKVLAFLDRGTPRDAWDITRLAAMPERPLDSGAVRAWTIALSAMFPLPLPRYGRERIEQVLTARRIREELVPMLTGGGALEPTALLVDAWDAVAPLLRLTQPETDYVSGIEQGEIRADLLFPDAPEAAAQVCRHPQIRWKVENVNKLPRQE